MGSVVSVPVQSHSAHQAIDEPPAVRAEPAEAQERRVIDPPAHLPESQTPLGERNLAVVDLNGEPIGPLGAIEEDKPEGPQAGIVSIHASAEPAAGPEPRGEEQVVTSVPLQPQSAAVQSVAAPLNAAATTTICEFTIPGAYHGTSGTFKRTANGIEVDTFITRHLGNATTTIRQTLAVRTDQLAILANQAGCQIDELPERLSAMHANVQDLSAWILNTGALFTEFETAAQQSVVPARAVAVQQSPALPTYEPVQVAIPCETPHTFRCIKLTRAGDIKVEDHDYGAYRGTYNSDCIATYHVAAKDVATIAQALTNQLGVAVSIPEVPQRLVSAAGSFDPIFDPMKSILDRIRQMGITIPRPTYEY